jgi:cytoskeletal protein CcmA (bactofilin family)
MNIVNATLRLLFIIALFASFSSVAQNKIELLPDDAGRNGTSFASCADLGVQSGVRVISCPSNVNLPNGNNNAVALSQVPLELRISGDLNLNGADINPSGSANDLVLIVGGNLNTGNNSTIINASVDVGGSINAGNNTDLAGGLVVTGNVTLGQNSSVNGDVDITGNFTTGNNVTINSDSSISIGGNAVFGQNNDINGDITATNVTVNGSNTVLTGDITATGNLVNTGTINGNINVEGNVNNNGSGIINGNVNVDGNLQNDGEINADYVNAPCVSSPNPNACGNGSIDADELCDINDNEGPCFEGPSSNDAELVGDWHFDEQQWQGNEDEVLDASGNNNHGEALGSADTNGFLSAIAGTVGTCRYGTFDGTNQVQIPRLSALSSADSVSVSLWFKGGSQRQDPNGNNESYQTLLVLGEGPTLGNEGRFEVYRRVNGGGMNFEVRNNRGDFYAVEYGDQSQNEPQLLNDEWQHFAATFDASEGELRLYINGTEVAARTISSNFKLNNIGGQPNLYIGGQQFGTNGFVGEIDEVTVATGVYTAAEVSELYNRTRNCGASQILAQCSAVWPTAFDDAGNTQPQPFELPDNSSQNQLPQQLQPVDYLRVGDFGDVGENYDTNGETSRVYIDGDLTIQSGRRINTSGDPSELIFIVTGDLTIERNVRINGYIYVQGNLRYYHANNMDNRIVINGGLSVGGVSTALDSYLTYGPDITYQQPSTPLDGGQFCAAEPPSAPQPLLNWRLNDGPWGGNAGEVSDSSGNGLNGRSYNGVNYQPADSGSAIVTDVTGLGTCGYGYFQRNSQQYLAIEDQPELDLDDEFTIGVWIKPTQFPNSGLMTVLSKDENYEFHVLPDGRINWWWQTSSGATRDLNSTAAVQRDQWNYVAIRYRNNEQTIFINGVASGTSSYGGGLRLNNDPLQLGSDQNTSGRYFQGYLDELSIFARALTQAEIQQVQQQTVLCEGAAPQCYTSALDSNEIFGQEWSRSNVSGSFLPQIVDGRARLTEAETNQSTAITLNGTFPAEDNLVELEFKLYAYGGSGADGIAVVFSDAEEEAIPGSYGGSLGYAQRNNGDSGFNGGWLGIGFDEFGNFSRATEGRVGGYSDGSLKPNRVVLRGAEETNYNYLTDSGELSPGIDDNSNAVGPGHKYRIRIDSRTPGESIVSVERDINDGMGYQQIVPPFNIYDNQFGQQPYVPENFTISFTGSTGGSTNIHEFDDIQVCAEKASFIPTAIDHYRLEFNASALTCTGATVTVKACEDSNCTSTFSESSTVDLSLATGADGWSENPVIFSGSDSVQVQKYTAGSYEVAIDSAQPSADNPYRCFVDGNEESNCQLTFSDVGFLFTDGPGLNNTEFPKQVAGETYDNLFLQLVELNTNTLQCQAAAADVSMVSLRRRCLDPGTCSDTVEFPQSSMSVSSGEGSIDLPADESYVALAVDFNNSQEQLALDYGDVGEVLLTASATLPNGKAIENSSPSFVWQPAAIGAKISNPNESFSTDIIARAGTPISVELAALNADGSVTPNFGNESQPELLRLRGSAEVNQVGEVVGTLAGGDSFPQPVDGKTQSSEVVYSEVGSPVFTAEIASGDYLAGIHAPQATPTQTIMPGRYIPYQFTVSSSGFASTCEAGAGYFYIGQPQLLDSSSEFIAVNAAGVVTRNYDSDVANYVQSGAGLEFYPFNDGGNTLPQPSDGQLLESDVALYWEQGKGRFLATAEPQVTYERTDPAQPEGPYDSYRLGVQYNDGENGNYYSLIDTSTVALNDNSAPRSYYPLNNNAIELKFARFVLDNLFGPPSDPLSIQGRVEVWDGTKFVHYATDNCSSFSASSANDDLLDSDYDALLQPQLGSEQLLNEGDLFNPAEPLDEQLAWLEDESQPVSGVQQFMFELVVPGYLQSDEDNDGDYNDNPQAEATFGIYQGSDRQIYWQEVGW